MQLVLDTKDIRLDCRRNLFSIQAPDGRLQTVSPRKITSIAVVRNCWVSAAAVELAATHEIPIYFLNALGKVIGRLSGPNFGSIAGLRRLQVNFTDGVDATGWMVGIYLLKTRGQASNLRSLNAGAELLAQIKRLARRFENFADKPLAEAGPQLRVIEAQIARLYWRGLAESLPEECDFEKRSRMPAQDAFNASLNYLYGMLYTVVESGLFAAGLDPHLGLLHAEEYNKPVLAFDFIEPFRPWVDWLLIRQYQDKKMTAGFTIQNKQGVFISKAGKSFLIPLFNEWLRSEVRWGNKERSVKNHIYQLAGHYAARLRRSAQA